MGWHSFNDVVNLVNVWQNEDGQIITGWNPLDSLDQMMMCVEKWVGRSRSKSFTLLSDRDEYACILRDAGYDTEPEGRWEAFDKTAPLAICQCLAKAIGESDE